jgi:uncharacterized protein YoxC
MDPNSKLLLDEMKKLADRFTSLESRVDALGNRFQPLEDKAEELSVWKEGIDTSVMDLVAKFDAVGDLSIKVDANNELNQQVSNLSTKVDRVVLDHGCQTQGILPKPEMAVVTPLVGNPVIGPHGHRFDNHLRENGYGSVMSYTQLPVKGTSSYPYALHGCDASQFGSHRFLSSSGNAMSNSTGHWPKLPFPKFDGENPKLWQSRCEDYFDMSGIDKSNWVRKSTMYFDGPAARCLQSVERRAKLVSWDAFCKLVHDRFGRDHHEVLVRQLFHIKQSGSVANYLEEFAQLVDQLAAYTSTIDPLYYTLRFIDGLRED